MSGKPAARLGDATQCPKKGHGSNAIVSGSPDVLFNGLPAARQGDTTACGSAIVGQVIPNVLINGRPAVVTGSTGTHGDLVIGGSGDIFIGGGVSIGGGAGGGAASSVVKSAASLGGLLGSQALAPSGAESIQHLRHGDHADGLPYTTEYEEEEEEIELPLEQRITLRIGMFFDGTGNNLANAALTEQCRREDLRDFDPDTLRAIASLCESHQYRDTNGDGLYDQLPGGSYGNAMTNIALLSRLYEDQTGEVLAAEAKNACFPVYVEGVGTSSSNPDSLTGMATGQGATGVVARVTQSPELISGQLRQLLENNPHLVIEHIEFDIFGFSRGAAAARHFANEVLKSDGGLLSNTLNRNVPAIAAGFDWSQHARINFIGLFDTVAAIIDPVSGDVSAGNDRNPGVNLYLPPGCARKVLHLTAQHEERQLFSLNQVDPAHEEIALPGVHSDIGGGYPPLMRERLLVDRPRVIPYQRASPSNPKAIRATQQWQDRDTAQMRLMGLGLPGDGKFIPEQPRRPASHQRNLGAMDTVLTLGMDRMVRGELSRVALRVMHSLAQQHGAPFGAIDEEDDRISIPADLKPIADKVIARAMHGTMANLTAAESRFLQSRYIHRSANWTTSRGVLINRPREGGRAIYPDKPQKGYPE